MRKYTCTCCQIPKTYSRSDKLYLHRKKYDPTFEDYALQFEKKRKEYDLKPRLCMQCNLPLSFDRKREKFCTQSCSAIFNNGLRSKPSRFKCLNCNIEKTWGKNTKGKYCSRECQAKYESKVQIEQWLKGEIEGGYDTGHVASWVRRWLHEKYKEACQLCGWSKRHTITGKIPLTVNHIDGNSNNHCVENLELICPNCHSLTSTYGTLNRGNGRTKRQEARERKRDKGNVQGTD